jgi:predicted nucleic acid-binding Zn ribbon protein
MPIYEYQCVCGRIYERIQRELIYTDKCDCGGLAKRVLSVSSVKTSKKSPDKPLLPSQGYSELTCGE